MVEVVVDDEGTADAGAEPDTEEVWRVFACAEFVFAVEADIDIVFEADGNALEFVRDDLGEGDIVPAEVDSFIEVAGLVVESAWGAQPDSVKVAD